MNIDLDIQLSVGLHRIRKDDIIPQPVNKRPLCIVSIGGTRKSLSVDFYDQ